MSEQGSITIPLSPAALADLSAMAAACGLTAPGLAAALLNQWMKPRLDAIRPEDLGEATRRFAIIQAWMEAGRPYVQRFMGQNNPTLYRWEKRWRTQGLAGLVDRRHAPAPQRRPMTEVAIPFLHWIRRLLMKEDGLERPRFRTAYRAAVAHARVRHWNTVSENTARRYIYGRPKRRKVAGRAAPVEVARERVREFLTSMEDAA